MSAFTTSLNALKGVVSGLGTSARADDSLVNKSIYCSLSAIEESIDSTSDKSFTNDSLLVLEDVCSGKLFMLTKTFQTLIISIYSKVIIKAPGFVNRNILNSMLTICNGKITTTNSRECSISIIGSLMEYKANDCGSQINETIQCVGKLIKSSDLVVRIAIMKTLTSVVNGSGSKLGDLHAELVKLAVRLSNDKVPDVRYQLAVLLKSVARNSLGCTTLPVEALLAPCNKGLEDELAVVQDAYADALAAVFVEQINVFTANQESAKHGAARGGGTDGKSAKPKPAPSRMSITRLSSVKKVVEDLDFRSVVGQMLKQVCKSVPGSILRAGLIAALGYLIKDTLEQLSVEDFEWLVGSLIGVLREPVFSGLSHEEGSFLKARFSHLIRSAITANLTEAKLLSFGSQLAKFVSNMDASSKTDLEMQLAFSELSHVVTVLDAAAIAILDEVNSAATVHLKHSSFGVRSAAAHVLSSLSVVAPGVAVDILRNALLNTRTQAKQLVIFDGSESGVVAVDMGLDDAVTPTDATGAANNVTTAAAQTAAAASVVRKKTPKEAERLQRMYYFHGHTLVISILLKNAKYLPTGLPLPLVADIYALGIELLQHDVFAAPVAVRNVSCSVVRAGSLIVSSCLSLGYDVAKIQLRPLLSTCNFIFKMANASAPSAPPSVAQGGGARADDLIYEIMSVEAALVCVSTLLLFCPEALVLEPDCQDTVVEGLETAFRALKSKYQPNYRTHFRFCTLHVILMECFSWLPAGCYPNSCQQVFVEALRVFRDSIQSCFDCTGLSEFVSPDHTVLAIGGVASYRNPAVWNGGVPLEISVPERLLMLRLEGNAAALQKKETEAFLAAFGKDNYPSFSLNYASGVSDGDVVASAIVPCAQIDSRTIDCAILLLSATFSQQSAEYQDKAVQLCAQAVKQFSKATSKSLGMFASEDERRRKDRKVYSTIRNVAAAVSSIVRALPVSHGTSDANCVTWQNALSDLLFDLLGQPYYSVRCAAASTLAAFALKVKFGSGSILSNASHKIRSLMITSLAKKGETMESFVGHLLALSSLWSVASGLSDVQSVLITTVFDCLRKNDSLLTFKSHGLLALGVIVRGFVVAQAETDSDSGETDLLSESSDVVEKTTTLVETVLANMVPSDDLDVFLVCLVHLLSATLALALKIRMPSDSVHRLLIVWKQIPSFTTNCAVFNEALTLYSVVSTHDSEGVLTSFLFEHFHTAVLRRREYKLSSLADAVDGLKPLLKRFPLEACNAGLDASLFVLLDYCLSCTTVSTLAPYSGLEIRRGASQEETQSDDVKRLMKSTVRAIYTLVEADVLRNPDTRLAYWILLCRAVALNLRSIGQPVDSDDAAGGNEAGLDSFREQDEDEDFDGGTTPGGPLGGKTSAEEVMTYVAFAAHCRDEALDRAPDLRHCRVQVKCVAIRCIKIGLSVASGSLKGSLHVQLGAARARTNELLAQLPSDPTNEQLSDVSQPIALFLNDLVNLSCACATYTIDDKPILLLQNESMHLLQTIVSLFLEAPDPDIAVVLGGSMAPSSSDLHLSAENKILSQFMSQILSAVRLCLSVTHCSELLVSAGGILCDLLRGGFVADKVIARRLLKPLFAMCEVQPESSDGSGGAYAVRSRQSLSVSEDIAAADHVVGSALIAQLSNLTAVNVANAQVSDAVKSTISSMVNEHLAVLPQIWLSIVIDGLRVLSAQKLTTESSSEEGDIVSALRGGLTFSSDVRLQDLVVAFTYAVPHVLNAYVLSKSFKSESAAKLFVACHSLLLQNVDSKKMHPSTVTLIVSTLVVIADKDSSRTILVTQWSLLLETLRLMDLSRATQPLLSLVNSLLTAKDADSNVEGVELRSLLTYCCLQSWRVIMPALFTPSETLLVSPTLVDALSSDANLAVDPSFTQSVASQPSTLFVAVTTLLKLAQLTPSLVLQSLRLYSLALLELSASTPATSSHYKVVSASCDGIINSIYTLCLPLVADESQKVCVMLMQDLFAWCASFTSPTDVVTAVTDNLLRAWRAAGTAVSKLHLVPSPHQLAALVLGDAADKRSALVSKAVLQAAIKFIQSYSKDLGAVLAEALLPALLCRLGNNDSDGEMRALLVKALLMLTSLAPGDSQRNALVDLIVVPLCDHMCAHQTDDAPFLSLCGKGFTHLARLSPDSFRGQVATLSERHRTVLQQVMMQALQSQQQSSTSGQQQAPTLTPAPSMKINMNKYKNSTN